MNLHEIDDGEAMSATEGRLGYEAPLPSDEVLQHMQRAVDLFGNQSKLARACGMPQPSLWYILNGKRAIYAEAAVAIEEATQGQVTRVQLRPDLWHSEMVAPARRSLLGPDGIAFDEKVIRAFLDARHRNVADPGIRTAEALVEARNNLAYVLGLVDE